MMDDDPVDLSVNSPGGTSEPVTVSKKRDKSISSFAATALPPCRVCNAIASGYHYGANTCEACKAFFRRSIGNEDAIKPCPRNGTCADGPKGKISCADCRHKKCLSLGMAKDGCRKGRYTYEKRTRDTKEIRRTQAEECVNRNFQLQNCAETAAMLAKQFSDSFPKHQHFLANKDNIHRRIEMLYNENYLPGDLTTVLYSPGHDPCPETGQWYDKIKQVTPKVGSLPIDDSRMSTIDDSRMSTPQQFIFQVWSFEAEKDFHGLTQFAKSLSGFSNLLITDRIILLKGGRHDCMNVIKHKLMYPKYSSAIHYCHESGDLLLLPLSCMAKAITEEFVEFMLRLTTRIQRLDLNMEDMAVLLAFVILTSDREGLQRSDQVERLQESMLSVLQYTLRKNHPQQRNILAETLLLLPMLRENSEVNKRCLSCMRAFVRPEVTPLLAEMIQA